MSPVCVAVYLVHDILGDQAQAVGRAVHVLLALHGLEQSVGQMGRGVRPHGRGTRSFGNAKAAQGEAEEGEGQCNCVHAYTLISHGAECYSCSIFLKPWAGDVLGSRSACGSCLTAWASPNLAHEQNLFCHAIMPALKWLV